MLLRLGFVIVPSAEVCRPKASDKRNVPVRVDSKSTGLSNPSMHLDAGQMGIAEQASQPCAV